MGVIHSAIGRVSPVQPTAFINEDYGCAVSLDFKDTWPCNGVSFDEPPTRTL
jgi:hypothetical protein